MEKKNKYTGVRYQDFSNGVTVVKYFVATLVMLQLWSWNCVFWWRAVLERNKNKQLIVNVYLRVISTTICKHLIDSFSDWLTLKLSKSQFLLSQLQAHMYHIKMKNIIWGIFITQEWIFLGSATATDVNWFHVNTYLSTQFWTISFGVHQQKFE